MTDNHYVAPGGEYLAIVQKPDGFKLAWWITDINPQGYYGYHLSHDTFDEQDEESRLADRTCLEYFRDRRWTIPEMGSDFLFPDRGSAAECLARINRRLTTREARMPDWAKQARKAGWKPPESWKP